MKPRTSLYLGLTAVTILVLVSAPTTTASLCQTVSVSFAYPQQALPNQSVPVTTTVAGSCTSDGEDYFAVRVDLVDATSHLTLASNSTPIGYNANNFSVNVKNTVTSPIQNQTWPVEVDTYLVQAGGTSGKLLLNSTVVTIRVGSISLPEFQISPIVLSLVIAITTLSLARRKNPKRGLVGSAGSWLS